MCTTCGCGSDHPHTHTHRDENGNLVTHTHDHDHEHERVVSVEEDILSRNNAVAAENRKDFREHRILALNFVSSPGSGKTELLCTTIRRSADMPIAVIEGDQQTSQDADRIRQTGAAAHQINTGKGCHLDAEMVRHAVSHLKPADGSVLFIENVGNLVCPAEFDLGEAHKVVILSVTEGDDKPLKYPDMFRVSDLMIINKVDLLPYVKFDIERCEEYARRVNPKIQILRVSATTGEGVDKLIDWLKAQRIIASL